MSKLVLKGYKFSEQDGHVALAGWLELIKNQTKKLSYHSSPNGFIKTTLAPSARKNGMRKGWPDLQIHLFNGKTLFIELKLARKGELSPEQMQIHRELRALGYPVYVVRFTLPNECVNKVKDILNDDFDLGVTV